MTSTSPRHAPVPLAADPRIGVIDRFRGEHGFLSNFHPSPMDVSGIVAPTLEHGFHMRKTHVDEERRHVAEAPTPVEAKRRGRQVTLRPDWEEVKADVMLDLLRRKFDDTRLANWLLLTGDAMLIEGNHWGDREWGAVWEEGRWVGRNLLGQLLMRVRQELRDAEGRAESGRLCFTALDGGRVRVGHGADHCAVSLEVEGVDGVRAAVVLSPRASRELAAGLRGQAGAAVQT